MKKNIMIDYNDQKLRGYLHSNSSKNIVVMLHGYTGNKTETKLMFKQLSNTFESYHFDSIRMDFLGHGESDGQFCEMTFKSLTKQAKTIINYAKNIGYSYIYLLGFSMGGLVALNVVSDDISKAIFISPAVDFYSNLKKRFDSLPLLPSGNVDIGGFELGRQFVDSVGEVDPGINHSTYLGETLFICGENDTSVNPKGVAELSQKFQGSTLKLYENCDHLYSSLNLYKRLEKDIIDFLKR